MRSTLSASPANFSASDPCATRYLAWPALDPVGDVGLAQRRHRRDQDKAELHRSQHRRPEFGNDAEHHQETVAALGAERAQAIGEARGFLGKLGEGPRLDPLADDFQRRLPALLSRRKLGVEPVERPVELGRARPGEGGARAVIVVPKLEQAVARLAEGQRLRGGAGRSVGGEGHGGIVTPLDGAGNVVEARATGRRLRTAQPARETRFRINASKRQ